MCRKFSTLAAIVVAVASLGLAASVARADTYACVNQSSGEAKIVASCTVGSNASPCKKNDSCVDLSLSSGANETWTSCTDSLCVDTSPQGPNGLDGSSGWGWDYVANAPVTTLTVGTNATLTVTALQPSACSKGTITVTYSSQDFSYVGNGDTTGATCSTSTFDRGGVVTCSYTDFGDTDKSDSFTFTPLNPTSKALVTGTVHTTCNGDEQASGTYPVAIQP
jgi:hypothetical protein